MSITAISVHGVSGDQFNAMLSRYDMTELHAFMLGYPEININDRTMKLTDIPCQVLPRAGRGPLVCPSTFIKVDLVIDRKKRMSIHDWSSSTWLSAMNDKIVTINMIAKAMREFRVVGYQPDGIPSLEYMTGIRHWSVNKPVRFTMLARLHATRDFPSSVFPREIKELFPLASGRRDVEQFIRNMDGLRVQGVRVVDTCDEDGDSDRVSDISMDNESGVSIAATMGSVSSNTTTTRSSSPVYLTAPTGRPSGSVGETLSEASNNQENIPAPPGQPATVQRRDTPHPAKAWPPRMQATREPGQQFLRANWEPINRNTAGQSTDGEPNNMNVGGIYDATNIQADPAIVTVGSTIPDTQNTVPTISTVQSVRTTTTDVTRSITTIAGLRAAITAGTYPLSAQGSNEEVSANHPGPQPGTSGTAALPGSTNTEAQLATASSATVRTSTTPVSSKKNESRLVSDFTALFTRAGPDSRPGKIPTPKKKTKKKKSSKRKSITFKVNPVSKKQKQTDKNVSAAFNLPDLVDPAKKHGHDTTDEDDSDFTT